jgi:hypothetical protein
MDRRRMSALAAVALSAALTAHASASPLAAHPIALAVRHGDCDAAVDLVNHGAASNDSRAAYLVGRMLDEGICVKQDLDAAARFFARGSELGDRSSSLEYAAKVGLGEGIEQSYDRAGEICRSAGLDPQAHMSAYALGYACTVRGVAGRLLRERLPARAFRPNSGDLLVDFNPATAEMSIGAVPRVEREEVSVESRVRRPLVDAPKAIGEAWQNAVSLVPKPDPARLVSQSVELPLDVDMTLEAGHEVERQGGHKTLLQGDIVPNFRMR